MSERSSLPLIVHNLEPSGILTEQEAVRRAYLDDGETDYRSTEWIHRENDISAFELVLKYLQDSVGQRVRIEEISQLLLQNSPTLQALNNTRRKRTFKGKGISSFHHIETVFKIAVGTDEIYIDSPETAIAFFKRIAKFYSHDMGKFFIRRTITSAEKAETPGYDYVVGEDTTTIHARSSREIFEGIARVTRVFSNTEIKKWKQAIENHHGLEMRVKGFVTAQELAENITGAEQEFFELTTADMGGAFGSFHFIPENVQEMMKLAYFLAVESQDVSKFEVLYLLLVKTLLPQLVRSVLEYMKDIGDKIGESITEFKQRLKTISSEIASVAAMFIETVENILSNLQPFLPEDLDFSV